MSGTTIEKIVGTNGNDFKDSTSANESFDLKRGFDLITVDISKTGNYQNFGEDIINLTKGENLTVLVKISSIANYSYNNSHNFFTTLVKGNDLSVNFHYKSSEMDKPFDFGTLTFKNFVSSNVVGSNGYVNILIKEYDESDDATGNYWSYNLNEGTVSYKEKVGTKDEKFVLNENIFNKLIDEYKKNEKFCL